MNTCKEMARRLPAYVDGDLDAPSAAEIRSHLEHCPDCRAEEQALRASLAAIQTAFRDTPEMHGNPRWSHVVARAARRSRRRSAAVTAGAAVAMALVAALLWTRPAGEAGQGRPAAAAVVINPETAAIQDELATLRRRIDELEQQMVRDRDAQFAEYAASRPAPSEAAMTGLYAREEIAATIYQAGVFLEEEYGLADQAEERYTYVLARYDGTRAASAARDKLNR